MTRHSPWYSASNRKNRHRFKIDGFNVTQPAIHVYWGGVILLVVLVAGCTAREDTSDAPVDWEVFAEIAPRVVKSELPTVQVGKDIFLTLTVRHPAGEDFTSPYEDAFGEFALIDQTEQAISLTETVIRYRLGAYFLPANVNIPSLQVQYLNKAGDHVTLKSRPIAVRVVTSLTDNVTDIHEIKGPIALIIPGRWTSLLWLSMALVMAFLAYLVYRRFRKEREKSVMPFPVALPPYEEARAALLRLAQSKFLEKSEMLQFCEALAEIMKRYAGRTYEVAYLERTTFEILNELKALNLKSEVYQEIRAILEASDLVKFARVIPDQVESEQLFITAESCVERTRPVPTVPKDSIELVKPVGMGV